MGRIREFKICRDFYLNGEKKEKNIIFFFFWANNSFFLPESLLLWHQQKVLKNLALGTSALG